MIFLLDTNVLSENAKGSLELRDSFIAATASARNWTVATSNTRDFALLGVQTFNPWIEKL